MASEAALSLVISIKDEASKGLGGISKSVGALGVAVGTFAGGVALAGVRALGSAVSDFLGDAITESRDAAKGLAQTTAAIKSTGGAANVSADQIVEYAGALSKTTLFTDDAVQGAENLLLTFTNVANQAGAGNDIFTQTTQIGLDMAQALGTDAAGGMIALGKAMNDPTKGIASLTRMGVTFTEQQKEQIKTMQASGDLMGAQKIVLGELSKEFGGSAAAAAAADGGFHLFAQRLDDVKQTIGDALMPGLQALMGLMTGPVLDGVEALGKSLAGGLTTAVAWLTNTGIPLLVTGWQALQTPLGIARDAVLTFVQALQGNWVETSGILPFHAVVGELGLFISGTLVPAFQTLVGWIKENATLLGQIAVAAGTVFVAFQAISAVAAVFTAVGVAIAAIASPIGLVALAVAGLALAWQTDFLGIQTTLTAWWTGTGQPLFSELVTWLGTNIPVAIGVLVGFWNSTLLPALQTVGVFIVSTIVPAFVTLGTWLGTNIPVAITALAGFWTGTLQPALSAVWSFITGSVIPTLTSLATGAMVAVGTAATTLAAFWNTTLLPALTAVWSFVQTSVIPLFDALANVTMAALNLAVTAAAGLWQNVLQPALSAVWTFISSSLQPVIQTLADFFTNTLMPAVTSAGNALSTVLGPAITAVTGFFGGLNTAVGGISGVISTVIGWLDRLAAKLNSLKLPKWLTPGSPTPLEIGLRGIADGASEAAGGIARFMAGMSLAVLKDMPDVIAAMRGSLDATIQELVGFLDSGDVQGPLTQAGADAINAFIAGMGGGKGKTRIPKQFTAGIADSILLGMPEILTAMRKSTDALIQEIVGVVDSGDTTSILTQAGADAINAFVAGMRKPSQDAGQQITAGMKLGLLKSMPGLLTAMHGSTDSLIQEIVSFIDSGDTTSTLNAAGVAAINALLAGMNKGLAPAMREMPAWVGFAQDLGNGLKLMGDQSPGIIDLGDGLRLLGDQWSHVADAATSAAAATTKATNDILDHVKLLGGKSIDGFAAFSGAMDGGLPGFKGPGAGMSISGPSWGDVIGPQLADAVNGALPAWEDGWKHVQDTTQTVMNVTTDVIQLASDKMTAILKDLVDRINDAYNRANALQNLRPHVSGIPSGGGPTFGFQARALGGPVMAGVPYIVGERRPEVFTPRASGTISPSVPRGDTTVVYDFSGMDLRGSTLTPAQVQDAITRAIATSEAKSPTLDFARSRGSR